MATNMIFIEKIKFFIQYIKSTGSKRRIQKCQNFQQNTPSGGRYGQKSDFKRKILSFPNFVSYSMFNKTAYKPVLCPFRSGTHSIPGTLQEWSIHCIFHSMEWNVCNNMHSIPWSECVRTHSSHIPVFEFSRFKRFGG